MYRVLHFGKFACRVGMRVASMLHSEVVMFGIRDLEGTSLWFNSHHCNSPKKIKKYGGQDTILQSHGPYGSAIPLRS